MTNVTIRLLIDGVDVMDTAVDNSRFLFNGYANASGVLRELLSLVKEPLGLHCCEQPVHMGDMMDQSSTFSDAPQAFSAADSRNARVFAEIERDSSHRQGYGQGQTLETSDVDTFEILSSLSTLLDEELDIDCGCFDMDCTSPFPPPSLNATATLVVSRGGGGLKDSLGSDAVGADVDRIRMGMKLEPQMGDVLVQGLKGMCAFNVVVSVARENDEQKGTLEFCISPVGQFASFSFCDGCERCGGDLSSCCRILGAALYLNRHAFLATLTANWGAAGG